MRKGDLKKGEALATEKGRVCRWQVVLVDSSSWFEEVPVVKVLLRLLIGQRPKRWWGLWAGDGL